ncbi:MAG: hypothetical protein IPM32_08040 [Ignavibacteriae bacterium]|nr:hypothetical protein [Ignavibacteriota bacterium]
MKLTLIIVFAFNFVLVAQTKTNLEIVDSLIGVSISKINSTQIDKNQNFEFKFNSPQEFSALSNSVIEKMQNVGFKFNKDENNSEVLNYSIKNILVEYPEMFRDGIFGEYLVNRKVELESSFYFSANGNLSKVENFVYNYSDTLAYEEINSVQNIAYGFTSPEIPSEPFFSSLVEPTIAIGTAAVAVYLFFNVRSK